jgi:hypothetical protein
MPEEGAVALIECCGCLCGGSGASLSHFSTPGMALDPAIPGSRPRVHHCRDASKCMDLPACFSCALAAAAGGLTRRFLGAMERRIATLPVATGSWRIDVD